MRRPLPRLHAITDSRILQLEDFPARVASLASVGPAVAIHVRDRSAGGGHLAAVAARVQAHAKPPGASTFVNGRPDIAAALGLQGVQLGRDDLAPTDARRVLGEAWHGWIGVSVHSFDEARQAVTEGAEFLMVGNVFDTPTHPQHPGAGPDLIRRCATLPIPVVAIGGVTPANVGGMRQAGAYGVAAIRALWDQADCAAAAFALLAPWLED